MHDDSNERRRQTLIKYYQNPEIRLQKSIQAKQYYQQNPRNKKPPKIKTRNRTDKGTYQERQSWIPKIIDLVKQNPTLGYQHIFRLLHNPPFTRGFVQQVMKPLQPPYPCKSKYNYTTIIQTWKPIINAIITKYPNISGIKIYKTLRNPPFQISFLYKYLSSINYKPIRTPSKPYQKQDPIIAKQNRSKASKLKWQNPDYRKKLAAKYKKK